MKSIADINQQMSKVQSAIMALNAMNTTVQSVMIAGSKPVIRIARNGHCARLLEQGKASYTHVSMTAQGAFVRASLSCMAAVLPGQSHYINHKVNRDERSK